MNSKAFKPLVVGPPRSGFALLCSAVIHFVPFAPEKGGLKQKLLNLFVDRFGPFISEHIERAFTRRGISKDLIYNPNFRLMVGGPKWLSRHRPGFACFRKYLGVRGLGDFTLITSHPQDVLDTYEVVHSHQDPALWADHPDYADYTRFASIRNPVGILNSSVFSINALTSEYIQRFVPAGEDEERIRQELALYKFTDLTFFEGLVRFLADYFKEFMACKDRFILLRWEDLIGNPIPTLQHLAQAADIPLPPEYAAQIWKKLDHVNLTGHHLHNYRKGKGKVGDWKNWITNEHLDMIRGYGFEPYMKELGYDPIPTLDEKAYTPFQQKVSQCLKRGEIYPEYPDADLFNFAFNKSNLVSDKFPFKRFDWKEWTQLERSSFKDDRLEQEVWQAAEEATGTLNAFFLDFLQGEYERNETARNHLDRLFQAHERGLGSFLGPVYWDASARARDMISGFFQSERETPEKGFGADPVLVKTLADYNIVFYRGKYYGLPHGLGEVRLEREDVTGRPGVVQSSSLQEVTASISPGSSE